MTPPSPYTLFTSESVGPGHPDKVADQIADSILDACLAQDPYSRVACEVLVKSNLVVLAGEVTTRAQLDYSAVARQAIRQAGYTDPVGVFCADTVFIMESLTQQSCDIARGVDAQAAPGKSSSQQGAGDQGLMFGYACDQTPELLPLPIVLAHRLMQQAWLLRCNGTLPWLGSDMKTQVTVAYQGSQPVAVQHVVLSVQHTESMQLEALREHAYRDIIQAVIPPALRSPELQCWINPTGRFVIGGPQGDAGLTGRKLMVDTYGGWARHGGGAFSGKDPSKVDRSAAYMARWVAKHLVAAGLAREAEVQVSYAIGHCQPIHLGVCTRGTSPYSDAALLDAVCQVFSFRPADIIAQLQLLQPLYASTACWGHFTQAHLPWEQTPHTSKLRHALGLPDLP
jgi:S-adenosylmethionine synthetase